MSTTTNLSKPTQPMEERLYQNRYLVDEGRPHVRINQGTNASEALLSLVQLCPAGCYREAEPGRVEVALDGCMECGTCRIVCQGTGEIEWRYPRGGFGVSFKFG
ncbi:MAG: ferredoxin family protein [Pseudomonadota bacterium]